MPDTMEFRPASRVASIAVSEILQIGARAQRMKAAGRDVIVLGAGEPDFDTPESVKDAAMAAIRRGETKYTALDGSAELKSAIQVKFERENSLRFSADQITVSTGAKQVIYNALLATLEPGDEVILPAPYWTSYLDIVQIVGGRPVVVKCPETQGFRLTPEDFEAAISERTRWVILNSPSNPSGAAYSREHYEPLMEVLRRHPHVWVLADDIYEHILYSAEAFVTPAQVAPDLAGRILTVNGVSKAYAMTGWRIGYGAGPTALIRAMAVAQSQSTSCPSSISQAASIAALLGNQDMLKERCRSFAERRDLVVESLGSIPGLSCRRPEGAFYAYVGCHGMLGRRTESGGVIDSDRTFTDYLLEEAAVAVVPGSAFGLGPYFRVSYATARGQLEEACRRIARACSDLG